MFQHKPKRGRRARPAGESALWTEPDIQCPQFGGESIGNIFGMEFSITSLGLQAAPTYFRHRGLHPCGGESRGRCHLQRIHFHARGSSCEVHHGGPRWLRV